MTATPSLFGYSTTPPSTPTPSAGASSIQITRRTLWGYLRNYDTDDTRDEFTEYLRQKPEAITLEVLGATDIDLAV